MKKIYGAFVMILMFGLVWSQGSAFAQSDEAKVETTNFIKATGVITKVEEKRELLL